MTVLWPMTVLRFMTGYGGDILCVISVVIKQFSEKNAFELCKWFCKVVSKQGICE